MLIDMMSMDDEMAKEVLHWHPMSYVDHFRHSGFRDRELAIAAYGAAKPELISSFEQRCGALDQKILMIQTMIRNGEIAEAAPLGKPLYNDIAELNGLIVGDTDSDGDDEIWADDHVALQSDIDDLFA